MQKCKSRILILLCFMLMAAGCACSKESEDILVSTSFEESSEQEQETDHIDTTIQVYICGEVKHPGVYEFEADERIISAIEAAGGLTKEAAPESVNQAQKMEDGQQIYIPSREEQQVSTAKTGESSDGLISINQATKEEFMTLPGIGEAKAESIISYREEHGKFQSTEDLMKISGIKEGVYNKIKDYITL